MAVLTHPPPTLEALTAGPSSRGRTIPLRAALCGWIMGASTADDLQRAFRRLARQRREIARHKAAAWVVLAAFTARVADRAALQVLAGQLGIDEPALHYPTRPLDRAPLPAGTT
ncbi:MAG: hypothetical protein KC549_09935, partial [Myxococcales bacterium]|nr:hypothetical protein [Myxococcales bacterium]